MDISFIIITDGKKKIELKQQVNSIIRQKIPNYEIIIVGNIDGLENDTNIFLIEDNFNANRGSLGGLRNRACEKAKYENLVISDDDMLFTEDWYQNLLLVPNFDILTTCIKNPDGTRFWDNACYMSPIHGHTNLNYNEQDDYLYMSGGQSWIIKKSVWAKIKWDEELLIYKMKSLQDYSKGEHNEDTDFALRCREGGYKIFHFPSVVVYHNDISYTGIGRLVRRRTFQKNCQWWLTFNFPDGLGLSFAELLLNYGVEAEAIDLLRKLSLENNFKAKTLLIELENKFGGKLDNSEFLFENKEYDELLRINSNV